MSHVERGRSQRLLLPYVLLVGALGAACLAAVVALSDVQLSLASHTLPIGLLVIALVVGELRPIPIARGTLGRGEPTTTVITISTTFAIALVVLGPLAVVLLVQGAAVLLEDLRHNRRPAQVLFNVGQYALAMSAARGVFAGLTDATFFGGYQAMAGGDVPAALAAGVVFAVVNECLVTGATALATRTSPAALLADDRVFRAETSALLVVLGVVGAALAESGALLLPLLALPVLAVRRSTQLAAAREHEALHDPLTGLPNRAVLRVRSQRALDADGDAGGVGVLVLDLDDFREVNDALGHNVGDEVLQLVARRLEQLDAPGSILVRLGGDEFGVLLPRASAGGVADVAEQVLATLARPLKVAGSRIAVRASVGAALADSGGGDAHCLLRHADIALYQAKRERSGYRLYEPSTDEASASRLALLSGLHEALEGDELRVVFQPQVDVATSRVVGVEALVRWEHPTRGLLGATDFVPLAEHAGLGEAISDVVLDRALAAARHWRDNGWDIAVAVNVTARQLGELPFPAQVFSRLRRFDVPACGLTLEMTESSVVSDAVRTAAVLRELRATGVRLAIDDFGTGHSSLVRLQSLAVDELKIDRSFVTRVVQERNDEILVRSVADLGRNLGLTVVAEGVETEEVAERLRELGCDRLQGFLLGCPMELDSIDALLRAQDHRADSAEGARVVPMHGRRSGTHDA